VAGRGDRGPHLDVNVLQASPALQLADATADEWIGPGPGEGAAEDLAQPVQAGPAVRTNGQLARRLGVAQGTVRSHLEHIDSRLEVSSRTSAVARAFPDRAAHS
jgi:hypothetical protein